VLDLWDDFHLLESFDVNPEERGVSSAEYLGRVSTLSSSSSGSGDDERATCSNRFGSSSPPLFRVWLRTRMKRCLL